MPVIQSAKKALARSHKKRALNLKKKRGLKAAIKAMRKNPSKEKLISAYSALDRAAKTNLIHRNKATRLKSRLAKLLKKEAKLTPKKSPQKPRTKKLRKR